MQTSNSYNSVNFTSVIPVKVYIDGMETFCEKNIKTASRQLINILAGPAKNNPNTLGIVKKLSSKDPDYNYIRALNGFKHKDNRKKAVPSDFFRIITDKAKKAYLFTGLQGEHLADLGKQVGIEKSAAIANNCSKSFDLMVAKKNYETYIRNCIKNLKLRLTEFYNPSTNEKLGQPVELNIYMSSNKKYGKTTFKMQLADIDFTVKK